jgi:hypothetical protein
MSENTSSVPSNALDLHPELETSSMLLTPTMEEHLARYAKLFAQPDRVLDVGAGDFSFVRKLRSLGIHAEGCNRTLRPPADFAYDTLNFSESVGYLSPEEFNQYVRNARKVVLKDFYVLPNTPSRAAETTYDFAFLRDVALPTLICNRFRSEIIEFTPNRERWLQLLDKYRIAYIPNPHFRTVIVWAIRAVIN